MTHSDPAPSPHRVPARRWSWWLKRSALAASVALCAWVGWREYDHRAAIREAQAAGWGWESREPVGLIRENWRAAGKKETWTEHYRRVLLPDATDLASARPLLVRLRPTILIAQGCPDSNLDALRGLTTLRILDLTGGSGRQNGNGVGDLTESRSPGLTGSSLENLAGLRGLTALQWIDLSGCTSLQNLDDLRSLAALQTLHLDGCTGLQNVDALRMLPSLRDLRLNACTGLSAPELRELRVALPKAKIRFPDGSLFISRD